MKYRSKTSWNLLSAETKIQKIQCKEMLEDNKGQLKDKCNMDNTCTMTSTAVSEYSLILRAIQVAEIWQYH